jgi:membrane protease YdiL (CAAX protease family)
MAPLAEETLFRGFMFEGLQRSRAGAWGAIIITSAVWTAIHMQYEIGGLAQIFVAGIVLGVARWRTRSLWAPICLHAFMNLVATVETALIVAGKLEV